MNSMDRYIIALISTCIAVLGWGVSSYINNRAFNRAEISKLKDKLSSLFDDFFQSLIEKTGERGVTEATVDDLITEKLSIIELHLRHLKKKSGLELVSASELAELRSKPIELISNTNKIDSDLKDMKMNILEDIEKNYTKWYFDQRVTLKSVLVYLKEKVY
ncbi:hypothetical protein ABQD47_06415 [Providencia rettgeri]|uniref:hypothetical protein n=1 Tax=Providencia TaxID=586 RepID=UPI001EE72A0D|nr:MULTISPECIES: hypothetical protein [Providencia]EJD6474800.1 hypothetical protein [Providencia rettgeri]MCG5371503.1 hypothetical protein [Providencia rettgeri]